MAASPIKMATYANGPFFEMLVAQMPSAQQATVTMIANARCKLDGDVRAHTFRLASVCKTCQCVEPQLAFSADAPGRYPVLCDAMLPIESAMSLTQALHTQETRG